MEHICLFCGTAFTAKREGKNYCSNTCRQKAFYKRNAAEPGSNPTGSSEGITGAIPLAGEDEPTAVQPESEQSATISQEPFYVKTGLKTATGSGETEAIGTVAQDGTTEKTATTQTGQPSVTGMGNTGQPGGGVTGIARNPEPYQWVSSRFNDTVEELSERDSGYSLFLSPHLYLNAEQKEKLIWVSLRLRSLLESLLQLHRGNKASCSELRWVRKAFTALQGSEQFNGLTGKFPYKPLIKELEQGLVKITEGYNKNELITVSYTRKCKQQMIAARYNLSALVPKQRPGELFVKEQKKPKEEQAAKQSNRYEIRAASRHLPYRRRQRIAQ